jgi:hypothetical protein
MEAIYSSVTEMDFYRTARRYNPQVVQFTTTAVRSSNPTYCHVSGFACLIRRGLDLMIRFIGLLYRWLQQITNQYLTHCHLLLTGHSTWAILTSNWTVNSSQSRLATDGRSVSQSVSLGVEPHLELMTRYLLLFDSYGLVFVGRPLWREEESVFCQSHCPQ